MKKILFVLMLVMAATAVKAQTIIVNSNNATLLQPAGSYIIYGDQVMNKKECAKFLSTRNQAAYEKFQSGLKCTKAGWWTLGAGLAVDLAGSILCACVPEEGGDSMAKHDAMAISGISCIVAGGLAIIASIPTIYVGYGKINNAIDMFNVSQVAQPQAYWPIQGSENGIGVALNF